MHTTTDARDNAKEDAHATRLPGFPAQTPGSDAEGETHLHPDAHASSLGSDEGGRHHILVPLDGSRLAAAALPYAVTLARAFEARITLLAVIEPFMGGVGVPRPEAAEFNERQIAMNTAYLESVAASIRTHDRSVTTVLRHGNAAEEILAYAEEEVCALIVISSHGRTGLARFRMGSVAQHVVRHSTVPTLVVQPREEAPLTDETTVTGVTVTLDGSVLAEQALPLGTAIARKLAVPLTLLRISLTHITLADAAWDGAYDYPDTQEMKHAEAQIIEAYMQRIAAPLRALGLEVHTHWQRSPANEADEDLGACLARQPEGLAVVTSHGRGGILRWVLGSTAESLLDGAPCPILIVRAGQGGEAEAETTVRMEPRAPDIGKPHAP